jgi:hypothetical protein
MGFWERGHDVPKEPNVCVSAFDLPRTACQPPARSNFGVDLSLAAEEQLLVGTAAPAADHNVEPVAFVLACRCCRPTDSGRCTSIDMR